MDIRNTHWPAASLLGRLSGEAREAMRRAGTEVRFPARRMLLQQDDPGDYALLLLTGFARIVSHVESGESPLLAIRVGGDLVGEMATLDGRPRSATVVAATEVTARRIGKARLTELLRQHREIGTAIAFVAHDRLRWANRRRIDFISQKTPVRVARVLAEIAESYGRQTSEGILLDMPLTHADIAALAGVRVSTTEKVLRSLKKNGIILKHYRRVVVTDRAGLHTVAYITDEHT